jgi:hypothetical protein
LRRGLGLFRWFRVAALQGGKLGFKLFDPCFEHLETGFDGVGFGGRRVLAEEGRGE